MGRWLASGWATLLALAGTGCVNYQWNVGDSGRGNVSTGGATGVWTLANISYAGMRAQNHPSAGWRILAFICGFPGTLVSFIVVGEGSGTAYGIKLPIPPRDGGNSQQ
jgi:hypothetical protein